MVIRVFIFLHGVPTSLQNACTLHRSNLALIENWFEAFQRRKMLSSLGGGVRWTFDVVQIQRFLRMFEYDFRSRAVPWTIPAQPSQEPDHLLETLSVSANVRLRRKKTVLDEWTCWIFYRKTIQLCRAAKHLDGEEVSFHSFSTRGEVVLKLSTTRVYHPHIVYRKFFNLSKIRLSEAFRSGSRICFSGGATWGRGPCFGKRSEPESFTSLDCF